MEKAAYDAMREAGVEILPDMLLAEFNDGNGGDEITSASFTSPTKPVRLECGVSLSCFLLRFT